VARKKKQQIAEVVSEFNPNAASERAEREDKLLERVGYRKVGVEQLERLELEREADAILRKADHDLLAAMAENVEALRVGFEAIKLPSNDPEYLKRLQVTEAQRNAISNKIETVHIVPDNGKTWIGIGLTNPRHHADALEVAQQMGEHFECRVITHEKDAP
jgi:DNA-binding protein H-NS